ncbi:MAG: hypothetical protein OJI67_22460 [Prosthecobacter sp.]|nr:hypothetical protein [Prosthecobacter sp.]
MHTKIIREGNVTFMGASGVDSGAVARACAKASAEADKNFYKSMRNPLTAAERGVRPWPEYLTAENVASWIVSNVSYSTPWEAHHILRAMVLENNA